MTRLTRFALFVSCALLLTSHVAALRASHAYAARVRGEGALHLVTTLRAGGASQQQTDAKKSSDSRPPIVVREIDVEALKKLVTRDEKKRRPLLLNFWATWCEPCRAEFPDLVKIENDYGSRGLDFMAVSIDDVSEIKTTVPKFLEENGARMPAYLLNTLEPEAAIQFVDPQWSGSLPAIFLYDAQGALVYKHMGRIKPDELRAAINKVISDK